MNGDVKMIVMCDKDYSHQRMPYPEYVPCCSEGDIPEDSCPEIIYERKWRLTPKRDTYGELSRMLYIDDSCLNSMPDYIGFVQRRRMFNNLDIDSIPEIIDKHEAILPSSIFHGPNIKKAYGIYHNQEDYDEAMSIIEHVIPEYWEDAKEVSESNRIIPHNMIICSKNDFHHYCKFIRAIHYELDRRRGWRTTEDVKDYIKSHNNFNKHNDQTRVHAFLNERLSNIFYKHHFKDPYYLPVNMIS